MRLGAGKSLQGVVVSPVLPHANVQREEAIREIFVRQQAVGRCRNRRLDTGAEAKQSAKPFPRVDAQAEVDDDEVGVGGEVDGAALQEAPERR